ncbi:MAG: hypothetical protein Q9159_001316 [Coniocarpon cinnabarinum]
MSEQVSKYKLPSFPLSDDNKIESLELDDGSCVSIYIVGLGGVGKNVVGKHEPHRHEKVAEYLYTRHRHDYVWNAQCLNDEELQAISTDDIKESFAKHDLHADLRSHIELFQRLDNHARKIEAVLIIELMDTGMRVNYCADDDVVGDPAGEMVFFSNPI